MSSVETNTAWKHLSSGMKTTVVAGLALATALVVWLNFIR